MSFSPLIPLGQQGLHFVELPAYAISISLTIEIHKNNTDKQYYKIYISKGFYQAKLTFSESYSQILQTFSGKIVPDNTSFSLRCELILNFY